MTPRPSLFDYMTFWILAACLVAWTLGKARAAYYPLAFLFWTYVGLVLVRAHIWGQSYQPSYLAATLVFHSAPLVLTLLAIRAHGGTAGRGRGRMEGLALLASLVLGYVVYVCDVKGRDVLAMYMDAPLDWDGVARWLS